VHHRGPRPHVQLKGLLTGDPHSLADRRAAGAWVGILQFQHDRLAPIAPCHPRLRTTGQFLDGFTKEDRAMRTDLECPSRGRTPEQTRDEVSSAALAFTCSRCLMGSPQEVPAGRLWSRPVPEMTEAPNIHGTLRTP